ncbi:MAG: hypothetical protein ACE5PM_06525 [Candidatus Hydrothermarchaeales archaeon]
MPVDRRAQLFTLDLLLALVPLTIMLGMSANAMAGVTTQIQEYAYGYSMKRVTNDAADVLVKTAGEPPTWNSSNTPTTVGLALYEENASTTNILDSDKVKDMSSTYLTNLLPNFQYYNLSITSLEDPTFSTSWTSGTRTNVSDIVVAERRALLEIEKLEDAIHYKAYGGYTATSACTTGCATYEIYEMSFSVEPGDLSYYKYWFVANRNDTSQTADVYLNTNQSCYCTLTDTDAKYKDITDATFLGNMTPDLTEGNTYYVYVTVEGTSPALYYDYYVIKAPSTIPEGSISLGNSSYRYVSVQLEAGR